jgi:uncharacterized protein involved in exopolysaccharide biosynthesis
MKPEAGFDLALYVRILRRRAPLLLIPFTMLTVVVGAGSFTLKNIYRVQATVVVRSEQDPAKGLAVESNITQQLGGVIQALSQPSAQKLVYEKTRHASPGLSLADAIEGYTETLRIASQEQQKDLIVTFTFTAGPAAYALEVVNAFAQEFVRLGDRLVANSLDVSVSFVQEQLTAQRKRLADLEEQQQRVEANLASDLGDMASMSAAQGLGKFISDRLGENQTQIDKISVNISSLEAQAAYVRSQMAALPATIEGKANESFDVTEQTLSRLVQEARGKRAELLARYTEQHPEVLAVNEQLRDLEQRLHGARRGASRNTVANPAYETLRRDLITTEGQLRAAQAERAQLQATNQRLRRVANAVPATERELQRIRDEQNAVRSTYERLLQRRQNLDLNQSFEEGRDTGRFELRPAGNMPPPEKVWPNRPKYLIIGMLGGFLIGLGFVLLAEYLDHSVRSASDLRRWVDVPVLGVLPRLPR